MSFLPPLPRQRSTPALRQAAAARCLANAVGKQVQSLPSLPSLPPVEARHGPLAVAHKVHKNTALPCLERCSSRLPPVSSTSRDDDERRDSGSLRQSDIAHLLNHHDRHKELSCYDNAGSVIFKSKHPVALHHESNCHSVYAKDCKQKKQSILSIRGSRSSPKSRSYRAPNSYELACLQWKLVPKFRRAVSEGMDGEELNLSSLGLGDEHFAALLCDSELVPAFRIRRWYVDDNRLTDTGCKALASKMPQCMELLDFSCNSIGVKGANALRHHMVNFFLPNFRFLNVSECNLKTDTMSLLCQGLAACPSLTHMNASRNMIEGDVSFGSLLADSKHLTRLVLNCNYLHGQGAEALFQGWLQNIEKEGVLADVDLAWNRMGFDAGALEVAKLLSEVLRKSVALYHLDISYNSFDPACCAEIGDGLRNNHHLYGLHFVGNAATMDADGFVQPLRTDNAKQEKSTAFGNPMSGAAMCVGAASRSCKHRQHKARAPAKQADSDPLSDGEQSRDRDVLEHQTTCWACEGWERIDLVWPLCEDSHRTEPEPHAVWAFTSLDGFTSALRLVRHIGHPRCFAASRMVPPDFNLHVIFQVDAALKLPENMALQVLDNPVEVRLRACAELPKLDIPSDQDVVSQTPTEVILRSRRVGILSGHADQKSKLSPGLAHPAKRVVVVDSPNGGPPLQMCRITEDEFQIRRDRGPSFYQDWRNESEPIMRQCFEKDWSRMKVERLVPPGEQEALRRLLSRHYREVISIYRLVSSVGVTGLAGFGVSQLEAAHLMVSSGLGDDAITKNSDLDRLFIASKVMQLNMDKAVKEKEERKSSKKSATVSNHNALVRCQFVEFILRVANQRFVQTNTCESMVDALQRMIDRLASLARQLVCQMDELLEAMHTEQVDDVFKMHEELLRETFKLFSGRNGLPGQKPFMSLQEFEELLDASDAFDSKFPQRRTAYAFRMGMITQPEETASARFQEMTFLEFQHALGAVVSLRERYVAHRMAEFLDAFISSQVSQARKNHGARSGSKSKNKKKAKPS